jgi:hypothetical protein
MTMELEKRSPPFLFCALDYIYRGNDVFDPWRISISQMKHQNEYWKKSYILDSDGKIHLVSHFVEIEIGGIQKIIYSKILLHTRAYL